MWDVASGSLLFTFAEDHHGRIRSLAFSPDGSLLATASQDGTARLWDAATGVAQRTLPHGKGVVGVAFSPDGARLATAGVDQRARVWEVASGEEALALVHTAAVNVVAFSLDGRRLATGSDDRQAHIYPLQIDDLLAWADSRITRPLTSDECRRYVGRATCPPP